MDEEKTLLQQIREKEQEYAQKLVLVKAETDAAVAAAKSEAESLLCTADSTGKAEAERLYWQEKAKIEADIAELKTRAAAGREAAALRGEKNRSRAAKAITGYVAGE
jgi:membrane protein involved in colicin uptake